jgi:hypothetical protein
MHRIKPALQYPLKRDAHVVFTPLLRGWMPRVLPEKDRPVDGPRSARVVTILLGCFFAATLPMEVIGQAPSHVPLKVMRYAAHLIEKYDANGDGVLQPEEWERMRGDPVAADRNDDGQIDVRELAQYMAEYSAVRRIRLMPSSSETMGRLPPLLYDALLTGGPTRSDPGTTARSSDFSDQVASNDPAEVVQRRFTVKPSRLPTGLPAWFQKLDLDGDGQITQSEFAPSGSAAALQEFEAYDLNRDGVITPQEAAAGPSSSRRSQSDEEGGTVLP